MRRARRRAGWSVAIAVFASLLTTLTVPASRTGGDGAAAARIRVDSSRQVAATIAAGRLLFVGASYTVGWGATSPSRDYADLVAARLHRSFVVDAVAGTGFTNPGPRRQGTFAQRIAELSPAVDPRVVVIQGGRDDSAPPSAEYAAVVDTVELAQRTFRHAQVVVLGPIPVRVPVYRTLLDLNRAIAAGAAAAGAGYVDPIAQNWITPVDERGFLGPIPGHPDDSGYADFATRLIRDLPGALRRSAPPASILEPGF